MTYIEEETRVEINQVLSVNRTKVINELLIYFYSHQKRVITALRLLAKRDDEFLKTYEPPPQVTKGPKSQNIDLAAYITPRFLGVLGYFSDRLGRKNVSMESKYRILHSFNDIIRFMGPKHLKEAKYKVVSTLSTAWSSLVTPNQEAWLHEPTITTPAKLICKSGH